MNIDVNGDVQGPEIKTFKLDGVDYQYEVGMTWESWVNSSYNTLGAYIKIDLIHIGIGCSSEIISSD